MWFDKFNTVAQYFTALIGIEHASYCAEFDGSSDAGEQIRAVIEQQTNAIAVLDTARLQH